MWTHSLTLMWTLTRMWTHSLTLMWNTLTHPDVDTLAHPDVDTLTHPDVEGPSCAANLGRYFPIPALNTVGSVDCFTAAALALPYRHTYIRMYVQTDRQTDRQTDTHTQDVYIPKRGKCTYLQSNTYIHL